MSVNKYDSPGQGPRLQLDDFHPQPIQKRADAQVYSPQQRPKRKFDEGQGHKLGTALSTAQVVGHQQYGNWQEYNRFYQPGAPMPMHDMDGQQIPPMMGQMPGPYGPSGAGYAASASAKVSRKRPQSSSHAKRRSGKHNRFKEQMVTQSPARVANMSMMLPQMMAHHPMSYPHPMMPMTPMQPYDAAMQGSMTAFPGFHQSMAETAVTGLTAASSHKSLHLEETDKKQKAKIELLEKKIRAKDQLFEDALASTVAGSCGCGSGHAGENKSLTGELKRRFLKLKEKYGEAEAEIVRLTKTVKVVEVEVREDTEPLREEIQRLKDERFDSQQTIAQQSDQITDQRLRIEQMERERSQGLLDTERLQSEISLLNDKVRSFEEELKIKAADFEYAQQEIAQGRETNSNLEIQISRLQSQLADSSLFKEWYEQKQKECDDLQKQFDDEQKKVFDKDDEIMALQDQLTAETETGAELREEITKLNERISELEEELANKPEPKDSSSSSSEEDNGELQELKVQYENLNEKHKDLTSRHEKVVADYERYKRTKDSEIEELQETIVNLEKRNVELKLLLRRNNIELTESPEKSVSIARKADLSARDGDDSGTTNLQVQHQAITEMHIETNVSRVDLSSSIVNASSIVDEKKTKKEKKKQAKKGKKKQKKRSSSSESSKSSSSSLSERSDLSASRALKPSKSKKSVGFQGVQESFFGMQRDQQSLLMSQASMGPVGGIQAIQLESMMAEHRAAIEERESLIQQLHLTVEELRSEIEVFERKEEEEKSQQGILGKLQGAVNQAMYKSKYEETQKRYSEQQKKFESQLKEVQEEHAKKEMQLLEIVRTNEKQISKVQSGELQIEKVILEQATVEVREKPIFLDRHIIEASDNARLTVLDRERQLIKAQFEKLFKKQIQELEANVLAYQDLLMTKEMQIKQMEKEALEKTTIDENSLQVELVNIKKILEEKITIIEEMKQQTGAGWCDDHDSEDELTQGTCTKAKLKRRVFKKIEHLNDFIRNEVTPEIHQRYAKEIESLISKHSQEVEKLTRAHQVEMKNVAQTYELKLREQEIETQKYAEFNKNQERIIKDMKHRLRDKDGLLEEQAKRIDGLLCDLRSVQTKHEGHLNRIRQKHRDDIELVKERIRQEMVETEIKLEAAETLIEQLKGTKWSTGDTKEADSLRQEIAQLKDLLGKRLKVEKRFDQELHEKDLQIQELLDYRKQWNSVKFQKLEDLVEALEKEKSTLKAKYKHKVIIKEESLRAELSKELYAIRAELDRKTEALAEREAELEVLYSRVEELEMMQSSNSLEVKEIHRRYKLVISQLKSENATSQKKFIARIEEIQISYQKELMRVEEAYLNKIEWYKANQEALKQEWAIKMENKVTEMKNTMQDENDRLTVIINLYKEKLSRRETENRNLLVELKIYKDKVEKIRQEYIDQINSLKAQLESSRQEWELKEREYLGRIRQVEDTISQHITLIEELRLQITRLETEISELRRKNQDYLSEIERLKLRISELEALIVTLRRQIQELQSRAPGERVVEKIVEKIVYRDRPPSEMDREVEEQESIEENFEVVGRVKVAETEAVFENLHNDD